MGNIKFRKQFIKNLLYISQLENLVETITELSQYFFAFFYYGSVKIDLAWFHRKLLEYLESFSTSVTLRLLSRY